MGRPRAEPSDPPVRRYNDGPTLFPQAAVTIASPTPPPAELLRLLLDQGTDHAVILLDAEGVVVGWLPGAEYTLGYTEAEMVGRPLSVLFTPEDQARGADAHELTVARADGRAEDDRWHVRRDGTRIWANGVLTSLRDAAGVVVGFGKLLRDRTDLRAQVETLTKAAERHKAFLGTLAHELRSPLSALSNAAHLLKLPAATDDQRAATVRVVERQVQLLSRLVEDVLDVTRVGTGKVDLRLRVLPLEEVLTRTGDACRPAAERRGLKFKLLLLPTPTLVEADPDRLEQVVGNLLGNAIKYTPDGGSVWVKATVEGAEAVFRVEDTGVGVGADMLPRIFDLFTQEASSLGRSQGGLGLGLPLVRELVELHGGTVQVRSEGRDKGSEFTVRLPLFRAPDEGPADPQRPAGCAA